MEAQENNLKEPTGRETQRVILEREAWRCDSTQPPPLPCAQASGLGHPRPWVTTCQGRAGFTESGQGCLCGSSGIQNLTVLINQTKAGLVTKHTAAKLVQLAHKERWQRGQPESHGRTLKADNEPGWGLSLATSQLDIYEACWQKLTCEAWEWGQVGLT